MANKYKNTQTLNPALRSIGNMNVRGVVKGGTSDADKKARYGLPVMVSETGYIDPSLIEGGSVTESRVKELIKDNLQPYNDGVEIKADIDGKASKSELPDIIKNQLQQNTEIKNEISNVIKEQIQQGSEVKTEITNIVDDKLAPYANGQEIKNEVNEKVNTSDYDADFVVFDTQTGSTKGEKIKNYIDNITPPTPENVIEKTDMSPYGQTDKTQTGTEIENAIGEKVATTTYESDFATFASEAGSTIGEKIRNAITGGTQGQGITETKLSECLSPYSTSSADITEIGTKIKADTNSKVATDNFNSEFAVFDGQTGNTKGEKIKAYIDDHGGDPTAILQADMSPYGQGDKAQTGAEIAAAIASAGKTDEQIKQLVTEQITTEITQGGSPINDKITEKITEKLQPYNSGQEIKNAIDAKPNAEDVVAVSDMSPFGVTNKQYIGTEIVAKIEDIIAENLGEEGDITVTIKDRANSVTKTVLSQSMSPYSQSVGDITAIGSKIKDDVNLKVNTTDYDADFSNFDAEQGSTKGAKIQSYINKELTGGLANKVDVSAMSPYNGDPQQIGTAIENAINAATKTDEQIKDLAKQQITTEAQAGGVIDTAIDAKIGGDLLNKTDLAPYGQTDKTQIGAEIAAAIQSAGGGHTDERIKELAEEKIVADVAGGGTIDTAISNKLTTEKVLRQGDLAPYGATNISETGKDIQDAINAVEAKTKTDQEIKELADGQITLNAVVPTDMGEFYTTDKTKIGENIKNAILAGGDPANPSVKQSDLAPYGVADVTQAGADIQNGINTAISNAFAPYTNGQSIAEDQALQNSILNKRINDVDDSIVPSIKATMGYSGFKVENADIINSDVLPNPLNQQAFIYVKGNNSYTFVDPKDSKLKRLKCDTDTIEEIAQLTQDQAGQAGTYKFLKCYSEPDFIICIYCGSSLYLGSTTGVNAFSRDGGQTWSVFTYRDGALYLYFTPFFYKDKSGNYYLHDQSYYVTDKTSRNYRLQVDDLSASLYAENAGNFLFVNSQTYYNYYLLNDNIILPNRDGNFYKSLGRDHYTQIYYGCYMMNITPQNWNDTGKEQSKRCYLRIVFADGRKENFDDASSSFMYSMIKIGNKLLAFGAKHIENNNYLAMAVCDDIHDHWDDPSTPLEFHEVTAKDNRLNGKTLAAGFLNLSIYGYTSESTKNGLFPYNYYNYYYYGGISAYNPLNDLPIIHIEADRYVYMIGMQNKNDDYSGTPIAIPIGMRLDLEKHEITDVSLKLDTKNFPTESSPNVFPCCYQYNIECYKKEGPFYQIIKNQHGNGTTYYYYTKISQKSVIVDSFQVGDILVSCRKMGESWLECNGSTFTAESYPLLAEIIKDLTLPTGTPSFLTGGTTTFKVYIKAK